MGKRKEITQQQQQELMQTLHERFEKNMHLHESIEWDLVQQRLDKNSEKLWSLAQMEKTDGEPNVVGVDEKGEVIFMDCAAESPKGRRSICYDRAALNARKNNKPVTSAMDLAQEMGVTITTEAEYRRLQTLDKFDQKTSSWITTPDEVRSLGGALFCDRRFNRVFTYHNGADSYYASRSFRGVLHV